MMAFFIGLFTVVLILDCLVLVFLVLIQLPKKEAGAGLAFGAGATDALFGAGSGTILTKITKYAAGIFFVLAIVLSVLQSQYHRRTATEFGKRLSEPGATVPAVPPPATVPAVGTNINAGTNAGTNTVFPLESPQLTNPPVSNPPPAGTNSPQ